MPREISIFPGSWKLKPLITLHICASILLLSFALPAGKELWRLLDSSVFYYLNGFIAQSGAQTSFWAWMNVRAADLLPGILILLTLTFPGLGFRREQLQQALVGFFALLFFALILRQLLHEVTELFQLAGLSPSLVLEPVNRLSELAPHIDAKDSSKESFPGDHAAILLLWAGYIVLSRRSLPSLLALITAIAFTLPRMVGGAHWFSDNYVGGLFTALIALAWAFYSPLCAWLAIRLMRLCAPLFKQLARLPGIGRLPFFTASHSA
ncbi:phosphatase PAP2 family protein [Marinobacterium aestuarii]|nr:phosphatase PAP2 family protein [Marinobacterium aestuarii]